MQIELTDKEAEKLLEILGTVHMVEYLKGNDNSDIEKLVQICGDALKRENKMHIFDKVFKQIKQ